MNAENSEMNDYPDDEYVDHESMVSEGEEYEGDQEFEDDQEYKDDRRSSEARRSSRSKKKKRRMFCGGCNRMENHGRAGRKSWLNSYITGLTFGLNHLLGPFKCTCCGSNRWIIRLKKSNAVRVKSRR